jgi:HNH endonuclease
LRTRVRRRARGRCEYCQTPLRYNALAAEIDHVIAIKHGGLTVFSNLAVACAHCNAHKGPNIAGIDPATGNIVRLFNPRSDRWQSHFRFSGAAVIGLTSVGRATINTLFINDPLELAARASLIDEGLFR